MSWLGRYLGLGGLLVSLSACSFGEEALWPSLNESNSQSAQATTVEPLTLNDGNFVPGGVTPGQPTGTLVGEKVQDLRSELLRLQDQVRDENQRLQSTRDFSRSSAQVYQSQKAAINARLQVGTTPGNPELVSQWNQAQNELGSLDAQINSMNALAGDVANTASLSAYLLDATRATFGLSGAVDEDHRQLAILEDEVNQTAVLIDRLDSELTEDIARQTSFLANERANLNAMSVAVENGEYVGVSLANLAYGTPAPAPYGGGASMVGRAEPLVVIRFDNENVDYEQPLFSVVSQVLNNRPNAAFDVVSIAPGQGQAAQVALASGRSRKNGERVLRSLTSMGLPADRVSLSATSAPALAVPEVHLYLR